jgi:RNA polymerase sigma factor (sigma-70 family)
MATGQVSEVIGHLRRTVLLCEGAALTDRQLLEDYLIRRDEAALAALVRRHGPMVWGVCRRVLGNYHDAEDAFQATFLVFVRKAASIASRELVAHWLYGVAYQTARKARATAAKRGARERQAVEMPEPAAARPDPWDDLQPMLDQELSRLPEKYRVPIVLCDLEGKTRKEAAQQLGCPEGTVAGRLARARAMLAKRLTRHGVVLSGGVLGAVLVQNGASAGARTAVVSSTIKAASLWAAGRAAAGVISARVAALAEGMVNAMLLAKLRVATAVLVVVGVSVLACGITAKGHGDGQGSALRKGREYATPQLAKGQPPKDAQPPRGNPTLSVNDLRGKWAGEKDGIKVDLTFHGEQARWQAHWQVEFTKARKPENPAQSPNVGVSMGADLKGVADAKAGRLDLYLPAYLGDKKEFKQIAAFNGRAPVGQITRGTEGTIQLRIIPTGYEDLADHSYDYPAVEGLILRRVAERSK